MRGKHILLLLGALIIFSVLSSSEEGFKVVVKTKDGQVINLYQGCFALVVGISDYASGWPVLPQAVQDAEEVGDFLAARGFQVTRLGNPTKSQLVLALDAFVYGPGQDPDNCLVIYFAGQGYTEKSGDGQDQGYLVPADAPLPDSDRAKFIQKALSLKTISGFAQNMKARHALFLFDSCFSGTVWDALPAEPAVLGADVENPVRQFITAGGADEPQPDRSIFQRQLLEGLEGRADLNQDGYVTGTELAKFLQERVPALSQNNQHPQYALIRDPNLNRGDIVFVGARPVPLEAGSSVYLKIKNHVDAISSASQTTPANDIVIEEWISERQYSSHTPGRVFIIDLDKNVAVFVNHKSKSYVETPLPLDMLKILSPEAQAAAQLMKFTATVSSTGEKMKIGSWNCAGYEVTRAILGYELKMKVWTTKDVPFDVEAFNAGMGLHLIARQMILDENSIKELMKIRGYQIAMEMSGDIMGTQIRGTSEVLEISKKRPPAEAFAPPAGYVRKDTLSLEDISWQ